MVKSLLIAALVLIFLIAAKLILESVADGQEYADDGVKHAYKECTDDSQCVHVHTRCTCSCGGAINTDFIAEHTSQLEQSCKNYSGPICDIMCPQTVTACIYNICTDVIIE